ncbi:MAG TPA: DUF1707 domain-containing protein [Gemmatimonadales bacterium]|nr:DUF1707 domain-containing protein [Gemmatimonadales bacterium]
MSALDRASGVRASDAERDQVGQILQAAAADGRLSPEEAGERLAAAAAARFRDELVGLIADLPQDERPLLDESPVGHAGFRLGLVLRVARFAVVTALLVTLWGFSGARFFWPVWPLAFMALGLLAYARRARWAGRWSRGAGPRWVAWRAPWWVAGTRSRG